MHNSIKLLSTIIIVLMTACVSTSPTISKLNNFVLLESGLYERSAGRTYVEDENSSAGYTWINESINLLESTNTIPLALETSFGFRFKIDNCVDGEEFLLAIWITHPRLKNYKGEFVEQSVDSVDLTCSQGDINNAVLFNFDEERELAAGTWTINLMYQDKVKLSQTYLVK